MTRIENTSQIHTIFFVDTSPFADSYMNLIHIWVSFFKKIHIKVFLKR